MAQVVSGERTDDLFDAESPHLHSEHNVRSSMHTPQAKGSDRRAKLALIDNDHEPRPACRSQKTPLILVSLSQQRYEYSPPYAPTTGRYKASSSDQLTEQ